MGAVLKHVGGVLLAGGAARRMNGADKPLMVLAGKPMLAHAIARVRPQCGSLLISINGERDRVAVFAVPTVPDDIGGHAGPLAGILAGLDWLAKHRPDISDAVTLPADTPFAPTDLVARLVSSRKADGARIAVAVSAGRRHHAVALWPVALRRLMRDALVEGEASVGRFAQRFSVAEATWQVAPFDPFFNINTPEDLVAAEETVRLYGYET